MAKLTDYDKAVRAAARRLPIKSDKQLNDILEYAADDKAEAYRIGAQEAQHEIINRIGLLQQTQRGGQGAAERGREAA